ncbi:MAG TPA: 2OG-Fe(II) oxygenase [Limnobacter sp.]|nr:2OG-Fe(II) oxygenase [Limnobacter sp.]
MNPFDSELLEQLSEKIASDLREHGLSVQENALPEAWVTALRASMMAFPPTLFRSAGVGRMGDHQRSEAIRRDRIAWIEPLDDACTAWLDWSRGLQLCLNRQLMLGLFSFESHFAHYQPGAFYKKHRDAFKGQANRVLSVVTYLNPQWQACHGGELVIYDPQDEARELRRVLPKPGTLVVFLSEDFLHEVLPATVDRYSIAGWYRVNSSGRHRIDPPV